MEIHRKRPSSPLLGLLDSGQAPWLDFIDRGFLAAGGLDRLIEDDGFRGVTSNPTLFEQAITGGGAYDAQLRELVAADPRAAAGELYEALAVADIRRAADILSGVYESTAGADGYVSLEVSPYLAHDPEATLAEARRLWSAVGRPNLMIKVPATPAGIPAIEGLISAGINVNVTLIFSLAHYEAVAEAYLRGLEAIKDPDRLRRVASVASFFVSRVDGAVDTRLEAIGTPEARALLGTAAVAGCKLAYRRFEEIFQSERFAVLAAGGARPQRVLWASTSSKNSAYRDVIYVEELIGPETVNTLPPKTLDAFRDHGRVEERLRTGCEEAGRRLEALHRLGVDLDGITAKLQRDGVAAFAGSFDSLLAAVAQKSHRLVGDAANGDQSLSPGAFLGAVAGRLGGWQDGGFSRRLWGRDSGLWEGDPEAIRRRLGWLDLPWTMAPEIEAIQAFADEVRGEGIRRVLLLGMGGSSLAPEVFSGVFGARPGFPELTVLDTTHPRSVLEVEGDLDPEETLVLVASKSGSTFETLALFRVFWRLFKEDGRRFAAITDAGSPLDDLAREKDFRHVFVPPAEVGGRYSALSHFGLVPAALLGVDVRALLDRALEMATASAPGRGEMGQEALRLGAALGELAAAGRDKLTLVSTPRLAPFAVWLEQLVAESTGKEGRGVIPVVGERLVGAETYGKDRFFAGFFLDGEDGSDLESDLSALEGRGHPVARFRLRDRADLGREIWRWELAVAACGSVLGVQPFDQPDVESAKRLTAQAIKNSAGPDPAATSGEHPKRLLAWLSEVQEAEYLGVLAFLPPGEETADALERLQHLLRHRTGRAVTVGIGPRYLHATGQLHKGGGGGAFLQLIDRSPDADRDVSVPGTDLTLGALIRAQADGDRRALVERGRPVLALDLGTDPLGALTELEALLEAPGLCRAG